MQKHLGLTNERQNADSQCLTLHSGVVLPQYWLVVWILAGCFSSAVFLCVECDSSVPLSHHGVVCCRNVGWLFRKWLVVSILPGWFCSLVVCWMRMWCSTFASWCGMLPQCWFVVSNLAGCFGSETCWKQKQTLTFASLTIVLGSLMKQWCVLYALMCSYGVVCCLNAGCLFWFWFVVRFCLVGSVLSLCVQCKNGVPVSHHGAVCCFNADWLFSFWNLVY